MRARFLATDYFAQSPAATASSDKALALASLPFPFLPVPTLPPDPRFPAPCPFPADLLSAVSLDGDGLDSLPVGLALSEFLDAVIPRPLPVPDIPCADEGVDDYLYDRARNGKGSRGKDPVACNIPKGFDEINRVECEKAEGTSSGTSTALTKGCELLKELRFELVEVDLLPVLQRKIASLDIEDSDSGVTLSLGVTDLKIHLDSIGIDIETSIPYPYELAESVYQVEKIPVKHDKEECSYARDSYCLEITKLDHGIIIPQLEVSTNPWELDECPSKADISNIFLNIVEHLNDGRQVHHPAFDLNELLGSHDMDMLAFVCKDVPRVDYQTDKPITVRAAAEMDLVRINDNILLERKSALYPLRPDGTCSDLPCSVCLEEVEIIDFPSDDPFKMLVHSEKAEKNTSDEIFKDDFDSAKCFYESVVSSELALVDDTFKSLPVPILTDDNVTKSMVPSIEEVLCSLKPLPLSAADGIYLDWHLLLEGPCNREICSTYASMVEEVKPCSLSFDSELQVNCQQTSELGINFLEGFQRSTKLQHEDKHNEIYVPALISHDPPADLATAEKYMQESGSRVHSHMEKLGAEKARSLLESMPQSNDLNFYLSARNSTDGLRDTENVATVGTPTSNQQAFSVSTRPKVDKLIEIHPVSLSDLIRGLIKDIHVSYTSAFLESAYLRHSFSVGQGLIISKQKLLELITGEGSEGLYNHCEKDKMDLIVLYALKQVAYYLCFFGLHAAHLYISNLTGSFTNIPERLRNIQCCIVEAQLNAERQLLESHPSLSDIEAILRYNTQISRKVLIVADRAFLLPLLQKLISMKTTSVEIGKYPAATYSDPVSKANSKTWVLEDLWKSDCILLDSKDIPASFPFSEFGIILEYGGPNKSSTLLSLAPKLDALPPLHFLYVKVDDEDFPVALVEDNHTDQNFKSTVDSVLHTLQKDLQDKMNKMRIVDSLNFIPATNQLQHLQENLSKHITADLSTKLPLEGHVHDQRNQSKKHITLPATAQLETLNQITVVNPQIFVPAVEKSSSTSSVSANVMKTPQDNHSASDLLFSAKIDSIKSGRCSPPETVIVVNTGNHGKCMLVSRRSSYQQILALEKGGKQVVERDVDLPVDLILSPAVCLVWYDIRIFGCNESTAEIPSITNFVDDIATNILMSLSFSFSFCIMVFEGENNFLSAVMEASDSLYASAASLDMNLQIFFSETPKSTDQTLLNCIRNVTGINKGPSLDISESESLAESFLTAFPSINPLSAHVILSSKNLVDFLSWSHEQRIQAVEKYILPPQSISLFSALCKFGELGESRSVMTDCSSVDSDISSGALLQSPRKRKKHALQDFSVAINDPICPNPLNQSCGDCVKHEKIFSPPKLRKFSGMEDTMPELPEAFMFDQSLNMRTQGVPYQSRKQDVNAVSGSQMIHDDFSNDLTPNFGTRNDSTSNMVDTGDFSWQSDSGGKQPVKSSFPASRPSFCGTYSQPIFPTALEINNDPGDWDILRDTSQTWKDQLHGDFATGSFRNDLGSRYLEQREDIMQTPASSLAFLKQDSGCHARSQGSSWELEYLRQMNEKRISRQERSRYNAPETLSNPRMKDGSSRILSAPPIESFRYQRNTGTPMRNQSPSNGTHRYGKGREGPKAQNHRVRKDSKLQPSINHEMTIPPSIEPTWTPLDKRARQKLSFATYGKEKQSKLVWRHQRSPGVGCGFPKRYREEGT